MIGIMKTTGTNGKILCDNINDSRVLELTNHVLEQKHNAQLEQAVRNFFSRETADKPLQRKKAILHPYRIIIRQCQHPASWVVHHSEWVSHISDIPNSQRNLLGQMKLLNNQWHIWGSNRQENVDRNTALYWKVDERFNYFLDAFETLYCLHKLA